MSDNNQQYGGPIQDPNQTYSYQQNYGAAPVKNSSTLFMVLGILELLFAGGLLAIIPLVLNSQYKKALLAGQYDVAAKKRKSTIIGLIVAPCVALLLAVALVASGNMSS